MTIKDRRASAQPESPVEAASADAAKDPVRPADLRADGSLRRGPNGVRTHADFFHPTKQRQELRRGELLSFLASVEYARREQRWYRRLWRTLRGRPPVADTVGALIRHHEGLLAETLASVALAHARRQEAAE